MKARRLVVLSLVMLAGCRTMPAGEVEVELRLIEEAIEARAKSFNDAVRAGDAGLIVERFGSEGYLLLPDSADLTKEGLLGFYSAYLQLHPAIRTETRFVSLSHSLDMAWEVGLLTQELDTPSGRMLTRSHYLAVWEKDGGTWSIGAQAIVPTNRAPETVAGPLPELDSIPLGLPDSSVAVFNYRPTSDSR